MYPALLRPSASPRPLETFLRPREEPYYPWEVPFPLLCPVLRCKSHRRINGHGKSFWSFAPWRMYCTASSGFPLNWGVWSMGDHSAVKYLSFTFNSDAHGILLCLHIPLSCRNSSANLIGYITPGTASMRKSYLAGRSGLKIFFARYVLRVALKGLSPRMFSCFLLADFRLGRYTFSS